MCLALSKLPKGSLPWDIWDINVKVSVVSGNPFHPWGKPQNLKAMAMIWCLGSTWIWVLRSWAVADSFFCTDLSAKPCSKPLWVDDFVGLLYVIIHMLYYPILEDSHNPFLENPNHQYIYLCIYICVNSCGNAHFFRVSMLGAFSPFSEGLSYGWRPLTIATSMTMMVRWSSWSRHILSSYHSV
jgi:hypothetical protein